MLKYFQRERAYLNEAAKEFARAHPTHARHLQIESEADPDPYVERLFEGFAFLAGRIHERLDDDFPEFTEHLIDLLYPHLLKPIPSMTMIEAIPDPSIEETLVIPRLSEVRSRPIGAAGVRYRFMTTSDLRLSPVILERVDLSSSRELGPRCRLSFRLTSGTLTGIQLAPLRLQFTGQFNKAMAAYVRFARNVNKVDVIAGEREGEVIASLAGKESIKPGGFGLNEHTLPRMSDDVVKSDEGDHSLTKRYVRPDGYSAFRLLQEYFVFPEKFLCVDVHGIEFPEDASDTFALEFFFANDFEEHEAPDKSNIRLHCTPAVNLFQCSGQVITLNHENTDYRVLPDRREKNASVYDFVEVTGLNQRTGRRQEYRPANSLDDRDGGGDRLPRFVARNYAFDPQQPSVFLSFPDNGIGAQFETVTTEILCCDAGFARQELGEGTLNEFYPAQPSVDSVTNLTRPTNYYPPPRSKNYLWQLLSHQVLSRTTLASREALANVLKAYDWTEDDVVKNRIDSILDVTSQPKEVPVRGAVVRGTELHIKLDRRGFRHGGEVVLFGEIMSRLLSHYATVNSFVHLVVEVAPSGQEFRWQPPAGTRPVI